MADHNMRILIDRDLRPAYYDAFHCLMSACRLNCCQGGWHIGFSKKDYETLRRQKGSPELNVRLEHGIHRIRSGKFVERDYGEFVLQDGACPLWLDGLCSLQQEKGAEVLPEVCRVFPRVGDYMYSGYFERALSVGCEGVLALLWELSEGVNFISDPLPKDQRRILENPKAGPMLFQFQNIRSQCIDFLQNRRFSLPERIFIMGMALRNLADEGAEPDVSRWLERAAALPEELNAEGILRQDRTALAMFLVHNANILYALTRSGKTELLDMIDSLELEQNNGQITIEGNSYLKARDRFHETLGTQEWFWENLMVTVFYGCQMPNCNTPELLWRSYVTFCNLYAVYRFLSVMSCREGAAGDRDELFRLLVIISRALIHGSGALDTLCDRLYETDSATLAHMAILLCG